jgi:hypothetical protein
MKTMAIRFIKSLAKSSRLYILPQRRSTRLIAVLLALATLNLTQGCYYFKVNTRNQPSSAMISGLNQEGKDFILHFNEKTFRLTDLDISNHILSGNIRDLDYSYYHYRVKTDKPNRYLKKASQNQTYLLNEVHLYVDEYTDQGNNRITVPVSSVNKVEIYDKDIATTTGSWILGTLGVISSVYLIIAILILIFKESCPFIYSWDGDSYHFEGEIFSGAIQPGLERFDYLRLRNIQPDEGLYTLKITNEIKEIQHINLAQLKVVDHPEGTEAYMDKYGTIHTTTGPVLPLSSVTLTGEPVDDFTGKADGVAYPFNGVAMTEATIDGVVLEFENPGNTNVGKLLIRAKNSLWLENVFSEFHSLLGGQYDTFSKREARRPAAEMRELMYNQGFPLSVYVERNGGWELSDFYEIAGPMAFRDDILAINIPESAGEKVRIKLETGFMFWELDYVAMDFSQNLPLQATTLSAIDAIDENGKSVAGEILSDDNTYYVQPEIGNQAVITFPVPEFTGESRTVFLESKGYYKILRDQKGLPAMKTLRSFRNPGRMAEFSKELFDRYMALTGNQEPGI